MGYVIGLAIVGLAAVGVSLAWRAMSDRRSLPCPSWLGWMIENPVARRRSRATLAQLDLAPGHRVLDAGCGPGRLTLPMARAVGPEGSVLAVDIQEAMLRRVRSKVEAAGVENAELLHAGLGRGKLPKSSFDRAVMITVLGEIPAAERGAALREIREALRPGGFLLVGEVFGDPHFQSLGRVRTLAAEAGLEPGRVFGRRLAFAIRLERPNGGA